jgi:hypothetical protein
MSLTLRPYLSVSNPLKSVLVLHTIRTDMNICAGSTCVLARLAWAPGPAHCLARPGRLALRVGSLDLHGPLCWLARPGRLALRNGSIDSARLGCNRMLDLVALRSRASLAARSTWN